MKGRKKSKIDYSFSKIGRNPIKLLYFQFFPKNLLQIWKTSINPAKFGGGSKFGGILQNLCQDNL